jgi:hypothetical protein
MIEDREDELSEEERGALYSLESECLPPRGMEERVVAHLRRRGLLRSGPGRRWLRVAATLAACLGLFLAGVEIGARRSPVPSKPVPARPAGERFVLLLYEGAAYVHAAPGGESNRIAEYSAWARGLSQSGEFVTGEKLKAGEVLVGSRARPVGRDQPGSLGGFFIIAAKDPVQAREIASTCPHLRHGGWIVIRQIDRV